MALSMDQIYEEILRDGGETPSKKVRETAQRFPDMIAMRYKEFGLWQETTYEDFWLKSNYLGMALRHFGVEKGNSVAIHSENRPEWFIADIGIQSMGYVSVGLYPSNPSSEVQYLLSHSESKILFAEDQEQVDKALEDDSYIQSRKDILEKHGLKYFSISNHLVGQCVAEAMIDERHRAILPDRLWGNGDADLIDRSYGLHHRPAKPSRQSIPQRYIHSR